MSNNTPLKIIHLSDLHFGTHSVENVAILQAEIEKNAPDLIAVSGDFAQIANASEFEIAHDFLNSLSSPTFCVPGNHDVPAWNLIERFTQPYKKYKKYITDDLNPVLETENALFAGINSSRRALPHWNWANGAVSNAQRTNLRKTFEGAKGWRICMLHHPIHKVQDMPIDVTVFGRKRTLNVIQDLKVNLVLTGHVHHASITTLGDEHHQTIYLSASTALSSRKRGQANGFNIIELHHDKMTIDVLALNNGTFEQIKKFEHTKLSGAQSSH